MPFQVELVAPVEVKPIVLPYAEECKLHTPSHPFCIDASCPCHEDADNLAFLQACIEAGVLTVQEADAIAKGISI